MSPTPNGIDFDALQKCESASLRPSDATRASVQAGDVLVYTTGAYVGRVAPYVASEPALASNHVNILRLQSYDPIVAAIVLNSAIGRVQTLRHSRGSAQAELYSSDIALFELPVPNMELIQTIRTRFEAGEMARGRATRLLAIAKRAVEIGIQKKAGAALRFIDGFADI